MKTASRYLSKSNEVLDGIESWILCFLMVSLVLIVFLGVLNRYILPFSMRWTEELSRYLMVWTTFVGASLCVSKSAHISVDAIVNVLPERACKIVTATTFLMCAVFCFWLMTIGYTLVGRLMDSGQLSPSMRIPIYYAYSAVPLGFALMTLRYGVKFFMTLFCYHDEPVQGQPEL